VTDDIKKIICLFYQSASYSIQLLPATPRHMEMASLRSVSQVFLFGLFLTFSSLIFVCLKCCCSNSQTDRRAVAGKRRIENALYGPPFISATFNMYLLSCIKH